MAAMDRLVSMAAMDRLVSMSIAAARLVSRCVGALHNGGARLVLSSGWWTG